MSIQVGHRYYFIVHAYHHFLGEVVEVTGKKSCSLRLASKIHSCGRGWEEFFRDGCKSDTRHDFIGDVEEIDGWMFVKEWTHKLPGEDGNAPRRQSR